MQTKIITTTNEFYNLKEEWERLQEQDGDVTYYNTFEYNWVWWDVYKNDKNKQLFIIIVELKGAVVGIAPLIIEKVDKKILSYSWIKFLGRGDYLGIILDRSTNIKYGDIIKVIVNLIELNESNFERLTLSHIKANSRLAAYLLKSRNYNKGFKYLIECPILNFSKYDSLMTYKNEFYNKNAQRYTKKLQKEVGYKFRLLFNNNENAYEKISELHVQEQNYLKTKGRKERSSLYNDKNVSTFIKKIYSNNCKVITFLLEDLNGNLLAYDTCYFYKRVLHVWNTAYNPKYEKYNLGKVIILEEVKYVFENNMADVIDFGAGRYQWKFEWTDDFIFDYQLDMWNEKKVKGKFLKKMYDIKGLIQFIRRKNG